MHRGTRGRVYVETRPRDFRSEGGRKEEAIFFSLDHAEEVHREAKDNDPVWDCKLIENMRKNKDITVNAIYDWSDTDVWDYIRLRGVKVNPLYAMGYRRVGCIGCPLATKAERKKEFEDFPTYKMMFLKMFDKMIQNMKDSGVDTSRSKWKDAQTMFDWWMNEEGGVDGQIELEEWLKGNGAT